jgi:hypothetical protein
MQSTVVNSWIGGMKLVQAILAGAGSFGRNNDPASESHSLRNRANWVAQASHLIVKDSCPVISFPSQSES